MVAKKLTAVVLNLHDELYCTVLYRSCAKTAYTNCTVLYRRCSKTACTYCTVAWETGRIVQELETDIFIELITEPGSLNLSPMTIGHHHLLH